MSSSDHDKHPLSKVREYASRFEPSKSALHRTLELTFRMVTNDVRIVSVASEIAHFLSNHPSPSETLRIASTDNGWLNIMVEKLKYAKGTLAQNFETPSAVLLRQKDKGEDASPLLQELAKTANAINNLPFAETSGMAKKVTATDVLVASQIIDTRESIKYSQEQLNQIVHPGTIKIGAPPNTLDPKKSNDLQKISRIYTQAVNDPRILSALQNNGDGTFRIIRDTNPQAVVSFDGFQEEFTKLKIEDPPDEKELINLARIVAQKRTAAYNRSLNPKEIDKAETASAKDYSKKTKGGMLDKDTPPIQICVTTHPDRSRFNVAETGTGKSKVNVIVEDSTGVPVRTYDMPCHLVEDNYHASTNQSRSITRIFDRLYQFNQPRYDVGIAGSTPEHDIIEFGHPTNSRIYSALEIRANPYDFHGEYQLDPVSAKAVNLAAKYLGISDKVIYEYALMLAMAKQGLPPTIYNCVLCNKTSDGKPSPRRLAVVLGSPENSFEIIDRALQQLSQTYVSAPKEITQTILEYAHHRQKEVDRTKKGEPTLHDQLASAIGPLRQDIGQGTANVVDKTMEAITVPPGMVSWDEPAPYTSTLIKDPVADIDGFRPALNPGDNFLSGAFSVLPDGSMSLNFRGQADAYGHWVDINSEASPVQVSQEKFARACKSTLFLTKLITCDILSHAISSPVFTGRKETACYFSHPIPEVYAVSLNEKDPMHSWKNLQTWVENSPTIIDTPIPSETYAKYQFLTQTDRDTLNQAVSVEPKLNPTIVSVALDAAMGFSCINPELATQRSNMIYDIIFNQDIRPISSQTPTPSREIFARILDHFAPIFPDLSQIQPEAINAYQEQYEIAVVAAYFASTTTSPDSSVR